MERFGSGVKEKPKPERFGLKAWRGVNHLVIGPVGNDRILSSGRVVFQD